MLIASNSGHDDPLYRKVDSIIQTLLNGSDDDTGLFKTRLEDLEFFLATREPLAGATPRGSSKVREGMRRLSVPVTEQDEFLARLMHAHARTITGTAPARQGTGADHFLVQARQLQKGSWIKLRGTDGKAKRARLSWMSPITKTYLFTDQTGLNAGNYSIEELAAFCVSTNAPIVPIFATVCPAIRGLSRKCERLICVSQPANCWTAPQTAFTQSESEVSPWILTLSEPAPCAPRSSNSKTSRQPGRATPGAPG